MTRQKSTSKLQGKVTYLASKKNLLCWHLHLFQMSVCVSEIN